MTRGPLRWAFLAAALAAGCNSLFGIHEGTPRPMCVDDQTIDDMEDGDEWICRRFGGRTGGWYAFGDGSSTGALTPKTNPNKGLPPTHVEDGARGTSQYAAHFSGSGFTKFGAIMGFVMFDPAQPFDAAGRGGITFWMRSNAPVGIDFPTEETVPIEEGGLCKNGCNDHFTFPITTPAPGWFKYDVPFNALRGGGGSATWNPRHLYGVNFRVPANVTFDVWVDDVAFYNCAGPECAPSCTDPRFPRSCAAMDGQRSTCQPLETDCAAVASWCQGPLLIDDLEDSDPAICQTGGRSGQWIVSGDGTSTDLTPPPDGDFVPEPIPGGRGTSHHAARLHGAGFSGWGADMGVTLMDVATGEGRPYDASQFGGITFWMKSDVPVSVGFSVPETIPVGEPFGTCDDGGVFDNCYNDFVFEAGPTGNEWIERTIPFAAVEQQAVQRLHAGGRNLVPGSANWDPTRLLDIVFSAHYSAFDVWVDDLRFSPCQTDCTFACRAEQPVVCPASAGLPAGCWPPGTDCSKPRERIRNTAVWGSGPEDVWVVGYSMTTLQGSLRHWKSSAWVPVAPPPTTGGSTTVPPVWGVWGSSASDVWAVADRGAILSWNGSAWSSEGGSATTPPFSAVGGAGPRDVWAVQAPGTMLHRTDAGWVPTATGTALQIQGVWGIGPGNVWAVSDQGTILHWDGALWSASTVGALPFAAVWGSPSGDVWAVGAAGAVAHLTGSVWSAASSGTAQYLRGVWGRAPDDVWAVGDVGTIIHWDGVQWAPVPSGTTERLLGVWGSGPADVWAVGQEVILRWDGHAWSVQR